MLTVGDRGDDVVRLQEYLAALGYRVGAADGKFGAALARAVEAFNADAGLGEDVAVFDPATVLWVGPESLVAAEQLAVVGATIAPGMPVVRGPSRPGSVIVTEPEGGLAATGGFGETAVLTLRAASVGYVPGAGMIGDPADVEALRGALAPATEGVAQASAVEARPVVIVPASALVQGADGSVCVYPGVDIAPIVVTPVGGGVGTAQLPDDIALTAVLSNPGRVPLAVPCGS